MERGDDEALDAASLEQRRDFGRIFGVAGGGYDTDSLDVFRARNVERARPARIEPGRVGDDERAFVARFGRDLGERLDRRGKQHRHVQMRRERLKPRELSPALDIGRYEPDLTPGVFDACRPTPGD